MAGEERQIERCHKHEQMAAKAVGKSEGGRRRERERKIWIRLKKASS